VRSSAALFALLAACASAPEPEPPPPPERAVDRARRLEREGDWIGALQAWGRYPTMDECGNCRISKERTQREGFFRCLTALDRHVEAHRLYRDAWLSRGGVELGERFVADLVHSARRAGEVDALELRLDASVAPYWHRRIGTYLRILKLRDLGDAKDLLALYLDLAPVVWWRTSWKEFRESGDWMTADAADALAELAPKAWEPARDVARQGGPRGFWALIALARMRHPEAETLIGNLGWIQGPVDYEWALLLRALAGER
jgi:hypothetical protein